ncbi:MAG: thioredoxin domain-containing protein [Caldivirga sp.]
MDASDPRLNCIMRSRSPYVLEALKSPVKWWGWCKEAFEVAGREDKPVLLDIGASWCHWCHVMDEETYGDPEVARVINENFIPIKVDRDERPDIDRRYQEAALLISGQGGWPLTVFLTPTGDVMFTGTYFPPRDKAGLPGMIRVLNTVLDAYRNKREQVNEIAREVRRTVSSGIQGGTIAEGNEPDPSVIGGIVTSILDMYDNEHGGFGAAPKFPQPTFHVLLLQRGFYEGKALINVVTRTLISMGSGGVYDQIGGGFHRYSVDQEWMIPHFEKLLIDNAELLMNYAEAYAMTGNGEVKAIGTGIAQYLNGELRNPEGGYYSSQDADVDPGDEGGYYRWSIDELRSVLTLEEYQLVYWYYGVFRFQHGEKAVLHIAMPLKDAAKHIGISEEEARALLDNAVKKLREARNRRKAPKVDTTIYAGWSAAAAMADMAAYDYLGLDTLGHALKTVDFIMDKLYINGELHRAYRCSVLNLTGYLDDYAYSLLSALMAYSHTGSRKYLEFSLRLGYDILGKFEASDGGFYDTYLSEDIGLTSIRVKPIHDTPNWSPNALALMGMYYLHKVTGLGEFKGAFERGIKALYQSALSSGASAASYFINLDWYFANPPTVVVIGDDERFKALWQTALKTYRPGKLVIPIPGDEVLDLIKDEAILGMVREQRRGESLAFVCAHTACSMPINKAEDLRQVIASFMIDKYVY